MTIKFVLIGVNVLGTLATVACIGKERKPMNATEGAALVLFEIVECILIYLC